MTPENKSDNSWDRVAAELRACREAQHQAWGDIDNLTLGRFLAGEVSSEEQREIENALDSLPELRKLTELVRDVLGESDAASPPPRPEPLILSTSSYARPTVGPWTLRTPASSGSRFRSYASLAAAACLLLALGLGLPKADRPANSESSQSVAFFHPVAERAPAFAPDRAVAMLDSKPQLLLRQNVEAGQDPLVRASATMQDLQAKGRKREAESLARQYVSNWTRQARIYQEQGDLARAEPALNQARQLCDHTLGPNAPETVRTRKSLAGLYVAVLDTPPTASVAFARNEAPLLRAAPMEKRSSDGKGGDSPKRMAMAPAPSSLPHPVARTTPTGDADRNTLPLAMSSTVEPREAMKPTLGASPRHASKTTDARTTAELRQRIRKQKQNELRKFLVPVLAQSLRDAKDAAERQRLARVLGQLGPAATVAVPALLDTYSHATDSAERIVVLNALGQIGPSARQAAPLLVEALQDRDVGIRRASARALVLLAPASHGCCKDLDHKRAADPLILEVIQRLDGPEGQSGIDDEAGCFSIESIQQAREVVHRLARTARLAVRIDTVANADALKKKSLQLQKELPAKGVCICLEQEPASASIFVSEDLQKDGLSEELVRRSMETHLHQGDFDSALRAAVLLLDDFEKEHTAK
jgi:hypothetical protein